MMILSWGTLIFRMPEKTADIIEKIAEKSLASTQTL